MDTSKYIALPNTPAIPELRFRGWRDAQDYQHMAAVREGSREWDRVDPLSAREDIPSAADVASTFPEADICNNPDLLLVEVDDRIIGYNHVLWRWTEVTGMRVYLHLGYLLPHWRGNGIGSAMLHWAQQRIRDIAADEQPQGQTTFATNVSSTEREADALMQHAGYTAVRRLSDMALEPLTQLPTLLLPTNITLRAIKPEHGRAVYRTWKDAYADMWTSTIASEDDYHEFQADNLARPDFDPALCHVAWGDEEVIGFVFSRMQKGVGAISEVAIRKAHGACTKASAFVKSNSTFSIASLLHFRCLGLSLIQFLCLPFDTLRKFGGQGTFFFIGTFLRCGAKKCHE